ncbi:MAG: 1,4-alpha-glucan branching protein domain-containing protein [Candidatus Firestonebacteria bacterium]
MEKGYICLVLHAHLPYVRHPEYEDFLEEDWFYEGITETYIPLLLMMEKLLEDKVDFRITMSLTPSLISMLVDPLLCDRTLKHIERLMELTEKEIRRTEFQPDFNKVARMYNYKFKLARDYFLKCDKNLVHAFKKIQDTGKLEIITCAATHGYLPLMLNQKAVKAQIKVGVDIYKKHFGRGPNGIWLSECGYYPGLDYILKENGIKFFFLDAHGIYFSTPRPKYGVYAPVFCKSGVAAFGRDLESSKQVWSAKEGYPGDFWCRDFYRDVGFDLEYDYIKPYINSDGTRIFTGIKYYRITGPSLECKEVYVPEKALEKAADQSGNFMFNREKQIEWLSEGMDRKPIIISPYDAELFGHWWYEGPNFLNFLFRKIYYDQKTIKCITPSEYLQEYPKNQVCTPCESSWGYKGYHEVWLEGSNDWIYRHLHKAADRMCELAERFPNAEGLFKRALNQASRELLLAQSSDWAFMMKTKTNVNYAVKRTKEHIAKFTRIYDMINSNSIYEKWLSDIEYKDNIFPDIDYKMYK